MILGEVSADREAVVTLELLGANGERTSLPFVLDTGFSDALMLSESAAAELVWPPFQAVEYILGDGTPAILMTYRGTIFWNGQERAVLVTTAPDAGPLIGMRLLYGFSLTVDVIDGGGVRILRLD